MKAALFDVDGTIFRGSLLIEHFKKMLKHNHFSREIWENEVKKKYELWNHRASENGYEEYILSLSLNYIEELKNSKCSYETIDKLAKEVIDEKWQEVYRFTANKIIEHKEKGDKVILISGSPDFLVEKFAQKLGVDYFATKYLFKNNLFSGDTIAMWHSEAKKMKVNELKQIYDLKNSYAYGDTASDLPMLKAVGYPTMMNPSESLLEKQDELENLSIIVERKNMIYNIKEYMKEDIKCLNMDKN